MAKEIKAGCARPTGGPVGEPEKPKNTEETISFKKEMASMIKVGEKSS